MRNLRAEEIRECFRNLLYRNRKTNPLGLAIDRHVQSNQLATNIYEGAPAVAGIDGGIGLQPVIYVQGLIAGGGPASL